MHSEGKDFGRVPADHHGKNKEYEICGIGWLFIPTLENFEKENDIIRILKLLSGGMIRGLRSFRDFLEKSFISCSCRAHPF